MSKAEHAGPRRNAGEGKQMMSIRHHPVCLCVRVCVCTLSCVRMSACTCIWFVSRNTSSGTLRCKSAQEGKCVYSGTDACSPRCFQAPWMTSPPPLSSHSGRSWEELNSYRHTNLKAQKSDKMWQAPELLPFSASPFLSHSCFRSPLVEKKNPSSKPAFTTSVNPSQLQSLMIRSLINATGKERSYLKAENKPHT